MALHINIEDLLSTRTIESDRIEYKMGWNPDAIYRSICAFANDFDNTGGGYILVGVEEDNETKTAKRPVKGLTTAELAEIQRKMIGFNNLLQPVYHAKLFIESVDGKQIIVLWIPGGSNRPYQVPEQITAKAKKHFYYIRKYANSVKANLEEQQELISLANKIPFDDRANTRTKVDHISMLLVKDYLVNIKSRLAEQVGKLPDHEILGQMELISGPDEHIAPRNVALMLFSEYPEKHFPSTQVEIVYFPNGEAADFQEFDPIKGPIPSQIKRTLEFLTTNFLKEKVSKPADSEKSIRTWNYPLQAIEETLVNAFYHRDYQEREPVEIRIYPNSIVFINRGGPDRSIKMQAFALGQVRSRRYRNRRLGEFLKELELTEGKATGIPTILSTLKLNGSPAPAFITDGERTFFEVELFIHPAFEMREPISIPDDEIVATLSGLDVLIENILDRAGIDHSAIVHDITDSVQANAIADALKHIDNQVSDIAGNMDSAIAGAIAGAIVEGLTQNQITIIKSTKNPQNRKTILAGLGVTNHRKNYENYMLPLIRAGWLMMTKPETPTSPKQQYISTLKGRMILELLKHNT